MFSAEALAIVPRSSRAAAATAANNSYRVSEPQNLLEMSEGQLQDIVWRRFHAMRNKLISGLLRYAYL